VGRIIVLCASLIFPGCCAAVRPAANGTLVSAGAEWRFARGWSLGAKFDGEFSRTTVLYSGTGSVRYTW